MRSIYRWPSTTDGGEPSITDKGKPENSKFFVFHALASTKSTIFVKT